MVCPLEDLSVLINVSLSATLSHGPFPLFPTHKDNIFSICSEYGAKWKLFSQSGPAANTGKPVNVEWSCGCLDSQNELKKKKEKIANGKVMVTFTQAKRLVKIFLLPCGC